MAPKVSAAMLIDAIKNYPVLFDKRHELYKDTSHKNEIWAKIAEELGVTSAICQKKFKNLKDTFTKIKNQIKDSMRSGAGAHEVPLVKWKHFEAMTSIMEAVYQEPILYSNLDFGSFEGMNTAEADGTQSHDIEDAAAAGDADEFEEMLVPETLEPETLGSAPDAQFQMQPESKRTEWEPDNEGDDYEPEGVIETSETAPRPRKVARASTTTRRPDGSGPSNAAVAAACLDHIKTVGMERRQKEDTQDTTYHFCMAAAGFLRSLPPDDQFDTMCSIQAVIQQKVLEVRARRTEQ